MGDQFNKGHYESPRGQTEVWLTPKYILDALGDFDLDPAASIDRPWATAGKHYTQQDNGLNQDWFGRVWLNPPYGRETIKWIGRLAHHGDGIALIFARMETRCFFDWVYPCASGLFFFKGRVRFCFADGTRAKQACAAPSVLVAYGKENAAILSDCSLNGFYVPLDN